MIPQSMKDPRGPRTAGGTKIAHSAFSNGSVNLWVVSPNAGGPAPTLLFEAPGWDAQPSLAVKEE